MLIFLFPATYRALVWVLSQVCRRIHDAISNSAALQFKIELFAQGMHDNFQIQDGANTADRLSRLTAYGDALKGLAWTNYETINLTSPQVISPYMSDGVLIFKRLHFEEGNPTRTWLDVYQLPSALRGVPARRWTLEFSFFVSSLTANVASDLLVLCECEHSNDGG